MLGLGPPGEQAPAVCVTGNAASLRRGTALVRPALSMSFPRCALLWARLPAGRRAGHRAAVCSALRAHRGPVPGPLGRTPAVASSSSSASGGSKAPNTSLFVPLTVKPQGPSADGDVGAELTRPLDKSECRAAGVSVLQGPQSRQRPPQSFVACPRGVHRMTIT